MWSQPGRSAPEVRGHVTANLLATEHQWPRQLQNATINVSKGLNPLVFAHPVQMPAGCFGNFPSEAYVTLFGGTANDLALNGLRVLLHTIRRHDRCRPVVVLIADGPSARRLAHMLNCEMSRIGVNVLSVAPLTSTVPSCLRSLSAWAGNKTQAARYAFTVFNAWRLVQFKRMIWLEPDQFLLRPLDDLWTRQLDQDSAGAAVLVMQYMPQCPDQMTGALSSKLPHRRLKFNTGVVVMRPSMGVFERLQKGLHGGLGSDYTCLDGYQTLWNLALNRRMECLHRTYNCMNFHYYDAPSRTPRATHEPPAWAATPAYNHSRSKLSCLRASETSPHLVHFAGGLLKPWLHNPAWWQSWSRHAWRLQLEDYMRGSQTIMKSCGTSVRR